MWGKIADLKLKHRHERIKRLINSLGPIEKELVREIESKGITFHPYSKQRMDDMLKTGIIRFGALHGAQMILVPEQLIRVKKIWKMPLLSSTAMTLGHEIGHLLNGRMKIDCNNFDDQNCLCQEIEATEKGLVILLKIIEKLGQKEALPPEERPRFLRSEMCELAWQCSRCVIRYTNNNSVNSLYDLRISLRQDCPKSKEVFETKTRLEKMLKSE